MTYSTHRRIDSAKAWDPGTLDPWTGGMQRTQRRRLLLLPPPLPLLQRRARHLLALLRLPLEGPVGCKGASAAEAGLVMMMVAGPRSMVMMLMVMLMVAMATMLMVTMVMMIVMKVHGDGSDGDKLDGNDDCDESPW